MTGNGNIHSIWLSDSALLAREPNQERLIHASQMLGLNPEVALSELRDLAKQGSVLSMVYLGHSLQNGIGTNPDWKESEEWYRRASSKGSALAAGILGDRYFDAGNCPLSEEFFRRSAERGYVPAMFRLGRLYLDGIGVERDVRTSRKYLEDANSRGHVMGKRVLGGLLLSGKFGFFQRLRGLWLIGAAVVASVIVAATNPQSDRLRG